MKRFTATLTPHELDENSTNHTQVKKRK